MRVSGSDLRFCLGVLGFDLVVSLVRVRYSSYRSDLEKESEAGNWIDHPRSLHASDSFYTTILLLYILRCSDTLMFLNFDLKACPHL